MLQSHFDLSNWHRETTTIRRDARILVQASHRAPFGKGTETVIDEAVRKTWEVDAGEIQFLMAELFRSDCRAGG